MLKSLEHKSCYLHEYPNEANEKKSVFRVTGLKILGRVGKRIMFCKKKSGKKYNFMHFERHFAFQNS